MTKIRNFLFVFIILFLIGCSNTTTTQSPEQSNNLLKNNIPSQDIITQKSIVINNSKTEIKSVIKDSNIVNDDYKEFALMISHNAYSLDKIVVNKDDKVRIYFYASSGTLSHKHGISIDEYNINQVTTTEDSKNTDKIEFTADKQGIFKIYCKTCWDGPFGKGHPDIEAKLVVQ